MFVVCIGVWVCVFPIWCLRWGVYVAIRVVLSLQKAVTAESDAFSSVVGRK